MSLSKQTELLSVDDVVKEYRIGRTTVYARMADGSLPALKIGRLTRLRRSDVELWLAGCPRFVPSHERH